MCRPLQRCYNSKFKTCHIYIYIYMELLVKPEMLTSYIYGPTFGNAETVSFYLLPSVSTLNQCREVSCVTFACKHFASQLLVKPEMLTSYIYIYGPTFGNAGTVTFYLLHNVSTLNQCREVSCVTFVCKHFASQLLKHCAANRK